MKKRRRFRPWAKYRRAEQIIETVINLGKSWLYIQQDIRRQKNSRLHYISVLSRVNLRLQRLFNLFALNMDFDELHDIFQKDMDSVTRMPACRNCKDGFICLTQKVLLIRQCRQCGKRTFYMTESTKGGDVDSVKDVFTFLLNKMENAFHGPTKVSFPGVFESEEYEGTGRNIANIGNNVAVDSGNNVAVDSIAKCPAAVQSRVCQCGFIEEDPRHMINWLRKQLTIVGHPYVLSPFDSLPTFAFVLTNHTTPSNSTVYTVEIENLVSLLRTTKKQATLTFRDLRDLVRPSLELWSSRDPAFPAFPAFPADVASLNEEQLEQFSQLLDVPPRSAEEFMTIRSDTTDICFQARERVLA